MYTDTSNRKLLGVFLLYMYNVYELQRYIDTADILFRIKDYIFAVNTWFYSVLQCTPTNDAIADTIPYKH